MGAQADMVIRECSSDEVEAVLELWQRAETIVSVTDTADDVRAAIANPGAIVIVAELDWKIAGSLIGTFDGWRGNMYRLTVHPEYRRRGIALALVSHAERWLASQGAKRITALVEGGHPWAVGFWSAAGYHLHEGMSRYYRNLPT